MGQPDAPETCCSARRRRLTLGFTLLLLVLLQEVLAAVFEALHDSDQRGSPDDHKQEAVFMTPESDGVISTTTKKQQASLHSKGEFHFFYLIWILGSFPLKSEKI